MSKKILFFQPAVKSNEGTFFSVISNGLVALSLYCKKNGFDVKICHFNNPNLSVNETVYRKLNQFQPSYVGINLTWHTHITQVLQIAKLIKQWDRKIPIIIGGSTASIFDQDIYKFLWKEDKEYYPPIDFIIRGDGEQPLLEFLQTGKIPSYNTTIPNKKGNSTRNPIKYTQKILPSVSLNESPKEIIDEWDNYLLRGGIRTSVPGIENKLGHNVSGGEFNLYVGKGCVNNCCYCGGSRRSQLLVSGRKGYSFRKLDEVVNDIIVLTNSGVRHFYMNFDPDPKRKFYNELFERLPSLDMNLIFSAWSGPIGQRLFYNMNKVFNEVEIIISPDSGSERLRKYLISIGHGRNPFYTNNDLLIFFDLLKYSGAKAMCYFMSGLPFESDFDRHETKNLILKILDDFHELFRKSYDLRIDRNLCAPPMYVEPCSAIHLNSSKFNMKINRKHFSDFFYNSENTNNTLTLGGFNKRYSNEEEVIRESLEIADLIERHLNESPKLWDKQWTKTSSETNSRVLL